jgi:hypothetical protein
MIEPMEKARRAKLVCSGDLLHSLLRLPDDVEVLDTEIPLRGLGLPDRYIVNECGVVLYAVWRPLNDGTAEIV